MAGERDPNALSDRPHMPGYGLLEAGEGAGLLPWSFVDERMAAARNYWVHTTRPDGRPHAAPVWGLWHDERFYFGTGRTSRKGRNLADNPHMVVHLESGDEAVILEGVAETVAEPELHAALDRAYQEKYDVPLTGEALILRLKPTLVMAWREKDFPGSATRWRFDSDDG